MHNQEEYQNVVDKKLITNLKKESEFLKSEITTKNEIIKKLLNNDLRDNKRCIIVRGTWDFDVTHKPSDSQSTCSTSNSEDSIIESRDVNAVNIKIAILSIDDQIKMDKNDKGSKASRTSYEHEK